MTTDWREKLREKGYRLTPQRELILDAVDTLGHATPDEVLVEVRKKSSALNVSTVYRTLQALAEADEVDVLPAEDGEVRYRRFSCTHHHHLVCRSCGRTVEVEGPTLHAIAGGAVGSRTGPAGTGAPTVPSAPMLTLTSCTWRGGSGSVKSYLPAV